MRCQLCGSDGAKSDYVMLEGIGLRILGYCVVCNGSWILNKTGRRYFTK